MDDPHSLQEIADMAIQAGWSPDVVENILAASTELIKLRTLLLEEERLANHLASAIDYLGEYKQLWPRECRLDGTDQILDRAMCHFFEMRPHRKNPYNTGEIPVVERPHTELGWGYGDR